MAARKSAPSRRDDVKSADLERDTLRAAGALLTTRQRSGTAVGPDGERAKVVAAFVNAIVRHRFEREQAVATPPDAGAAPNSQASWRDRRAAPDR